MIPLFLLLALALVNWQIMQKEWILREGRLVLLELAPVDPRSLMQGDYMRLNYALARKVEQRWRESGERAAPPRQGKLKISLDADQVARFEGIYQTGEPLKANQYLLEFRYRGHQFRLGAESFFFQEGQASRYARAEYGGLRVAPDGRAVLVGLYDGQKRRIGKDGG